MCCQCLYACIGAPAGAPMRIIGVECRSGALVDSITLFTSDGNCIKIGGSGGGNCNKVL